MFQFQVPRQLDLLNLNHGGWRLVKVGKVYTLGRLVTLDGTANQQAAIPFPLPGARTTALQLNKVSIFYNDATAKDHEFRIYAAGSLGSYESYMTKTADTVQPHNAIFGIEFQYVTLAQLLFNWSNTTNGKTADVTVTLEEVQ